MSGQRRRLARHALHQITVRNNREDRVIDDLMAGAVEIRGEVFLRHRHANAVGQALAQRPGGRLDAHAVSVLAVAGALAAKLAETHEFAQRQIVAGQVQQAIKEHTAVAGRKHEAVAVDPERILRIVVEVVRPEHVRHRRLAHRARRDAAGGAFYRRRR